MLDAFFACLMRAFSSFSSSIGCTEASEIWVVRVSLESLLDFNSSYNSFSTTVLPVIVSISDSKAAFSCYKE